MIFFQISFSCFFFHLSFLCKDCSQEAFPLNLFFFSLGSNAPFNWLTQSSLDTFADASLMETNSLSSLLFTVGSSSKGGDSKTRVATKHHHTGTGSNFGKQMARTERTGNSAGPKNDSWSFLVFIL